MKILNLILDIAVIALPLFFVIGCIIALIIEANQEYEEEPIKKTNKKDKKNRFELKNYSN